jgi:hypothetical protein
MEAGSEEALVEGVASAEVPVEGAGSEEALVEGAVLEAPVEGAVLEVPAGDLASEAHRPEDLAATTTGMGRVVWAVARLCSFPWRLLLCWRYSAYASCKAYLLCARL